MGIDCKEELQASHLPQLETCLQCRTNDVFYSQGNVEHFLAVSVCLLMYQCPIVICFDIYIQGFLFIQICLLFHNILSHTSNGCLPSSEDQNVRHSSDFGRKSGSFLRLKSQLKINVLNLTFLDKIKS